MGMGEASKLSYHLGSSRLVAVVMEKRLIGAVTDKPSLDGLSSWMGMPYTKMEKPWGSSGLREEIKFAFVLLFLKCP